MILGHQLPKARSFGEQWREEWCLYLQRFVGFTGTKSQLFATTSQDRKIKNGELFGNKH